MSKIHFQASTETIIGIALFVGVFIVFIVNASIVVTSLINVYGVSKSLPSASAIDDSVLSQALQILQNKKL